MGLNLAGQPTHAAAVQRTLAGGSPPVRPVDLETRIGALRGRGTPLAPADQAFFGQHLGSDFSSVRVHAGAEAGAIARSLRARAFTVGSDIVFAPGQYAANSREGRRLIAHELTHVVQQEHTRDPLAPSPAVRAAPGVVYRAASEPTSEDPARAADPFDEDAYAPMGYWWRPILSQSTKPRLAEVRAAIVASGHVDATVLAESAPKWIVRGQGRYPYWSFRHPTRGVVARAAVTVGGWSAAQGVLYGAHLFLPETTAKHAVRTEPPTAMMLRSTLQPADDAVPYVRVDGATADIDWGVAGSSFVDTAAKGLAVVAGAGLLVGLEVMTLGQVTWLFVGLGLTTGSLALVDRRQEAEAEGKHVPMANSVLHAAGDVLGASPLYEAASGVRLGTERVLTTEERSRQLGSGAGAIATMPGGPKTFGGGARIGSRIKLRGPGEVPPGPGGAKAQLPPLRQVNEPTLNPAAGPVERATAAALPADLRIGFYRWMELVRSKGPVIENMLSSMTPERIEAVSGRYAAVHRKDVAAADLAVSMRSDPLNPAHKHKVQYGDVTVKSTHPLTRVPDGETAQALGISRRTGQPIEEFKTTPTGEKYPGIDGVIGKRRRPMQMKQSFGRENIGWVRVHAVDSLVKAKANGYTHVEVHITMHGCTKAEVMAAWNGTPSHSRGTGAVFDDKGTIARIKIWASDGVIVMEPPLPAPRVMGPVRLPNDLGDQEGEPNE